VVIGANAREVAPALRQRAVSIALNREWEKASRFIRVAVRTAPPGSTALMLLLADQVAVTGDDLSDCMPPDAERDPHCAALHGSARLPAIFALGLHGPARPAR
jgi:CTP:molybdopterin cytidylyltransferase MocA